MLRSPIHPAEYSFMRLVLPSGTRVELQVGLLAINRIGLISLVRRQLTALWHIPSTENDQALV